MSEYTDRLIPYVNDAIAGLFGQPSSSSSASGSLLGAGPPSAGLGVAGNSYWDETNKLLYIKDSEGWNIH